MADADPADRERQQTSHGTYRQDGGILGDGFEGVMSAFATSITRLVCVGCLVGNMV